MKYDVEKEEELYKKEFMGEYAETYAFVEDCSMG